MASSIQLNSTNNSEMKIEYQGTSGVPKTVVVPDSNMTVAGIVDSGTNANGTYIKYEDGTLICHATYDQSVACTTALGSLYIGNGTAVSYPSAFLAEPVTTVRIWASSSTSIIGGGRPVTSNASIIGFQVLSATSTTQTCTFRYIAIGRWK